MENLCKWQGIGISPGISLGPTWILANESQMPFLEKKIECINPALELERLQTALTQVGGDLKNFEAQVKVEGNDEAAEIFAAHQVMLEDVGFGVEACERLKKNGNLSAEMAINQVAQEIITNFEQLDDEYFRERATDIRDILGQVLRALCSKDQVAECFPKYGEYIVVADELTPAQTISLPKDRVRGFIVRKGGRTSHVAILAKTYGIASVVLPNATWEELKELTAVKLDGTTGEVEVLTQEEMGQLTLNQSKEQEDFRSQIPSQFAHITLAANIGGPEDLGLVKKFQAQGVGLYRTEFLFMGDQLPTEDEQTEAYQKVIAGCAPDTTVIRTLDIGGDKQAPALNLPKEQNPFLGVRALRFCMAEPEIFLTQLRALWRASVAGPTAVMFPMIATLDEIRTAKEYLYRARDMVIASGKPVGEIQVGMMIEIPAAALSARLFASEVEFFSIGTNDLIQYMMAADRENSALNYLSQTYHPAILNMIAQVTEAGKEKGIWTGICGEAGGDPLLAPFFAAIGIDELSMAPGQLPLVYQKLSQVKMEPAELKAYAEKILASKDLKEVCKLLTD